LANEKKQEVDYDDQLKLKNNRLHHVKAQKEKKNQAYRDYDHGRYIKESPKDDEKDFLHKVASWFREASEGDVHNPSNWPGENGRAVVIPQELKAEEKRRFPENQFNIVASELIALNRSVPDQRSQQ